MVCAKIGEGNVTSLVTLLRELRPGFWLCVPERSSSKEAFFLLSEEELEALALLDSN